MPNQTEKNKIREFYANEIEKDRLESELFLLEGIRTKEIIGRYLSGNTMRIADIGGGAGYYSFWLQSKGHRVTLVDLSPKNIELATAHAVKTGIQLYGAEIGDATDLKFADAQFDLVLLLGPLYHLTIREERLKALSEARRVLKTNGVLLTAVISRYASLFDGFRRDLINDDLFEKILTDDLKTGVHLNSTDNPEYFTTAYFHTPSEIKNEINESKLKFDKLIGIESFGWTIEDIRSKSEDQNYMSKLRRIMSLVEDKDDIMALSPHIMAIARKE